MCIFSHTIDPNPKMLKMMIILKIMLVINIAIAITRAFFNFDDFFADLLSVFFLLATNFSLYFLHAQLYIIIVMINVVQLLCKIGGIFQLVYFEFFKTMTGKQLFLIGLYSFSMMFYFFAIFFTFLAYREMKGIFLANRGLEFHQNADIEGGINSPAVNNNNYNNHNNNQGYQPFGGYGIVVGE